MSQVYPHLVTYWPNLKLHRGSTVLVPLCGKSLDMYWLTERGHRVIGVDVSEIAIREVMKHSGQSFTESSRGPFTVFTGGPLQLWLGDFLKLKARYLSNIDAIYDKAALIALPPDQRKEYARVILQLCAPDTRIFQNTLEYEQTEMTGPPFSVRQNELQDLYGSRFRIRPLHEESVLGDMQKLRRRGLHSGLRERVYLLKPR